MRNAFPMMSWVSTSFRCLFVLSECAHCILNDVTCFGMCSVLGRAFRMCAMRFHPCHERREFFRVFSMCSAFFVVNTSTSVRCICVHFCFYHRRVLGLCSRLYEHAQSNPILIIVSRRQSQNTNQHNRENNNERDAFHEFHVDSLT